MELKKKSIEVFREEVSYFLEKLHKKHTKDREGSFLFLLEQMKEFHNDFKDVYGYLEGDLLLNYINDLRRDGSDRYFTAYRLAYKIYAEFSEEVKGNSIIIRNLHSSIDYYRAIKIINQLYDLKMDTKKISDLKLLMQGTYYIGNISIKVYKNNMNLKITKLKEPKYTIKKRKEIQGVKRAK